MKTVINIAHMHVHLDLADHAPVGELLTSTTQQIAAPMVGDTQPTDSARFVRTDDALTGATVLDRSTGLVWSDTLAEGEGVTFAAAEAACAALGEGWRLPTLRELLALVDYTRHEPAIDAEAFPDTQSRWYWTSSPAAWSSADVWVVGFNGGLSDTIDRDDNDARVRAVRVAGPAGQ